MTDNFKNLSDAELKAMLLETVRIDSLSREDLIAELTAKNITPQNTNMIGDLEIHPLSELAKAAASPGQAQIKEIQSQIPDPKSHLGCLSQTPCLGGGNGGRARPTVGVNIVNLNHSDCRFHVLL